MFNNKHLNLFTKILLFPFAIIYGFIIWLRNKMYATGFIGSTNFEVTVITVGNLSVGGTGKTPMVELLIDILKDKYPIAVLSRGYKRKTSGYYSVQPMHTIREVGDEPLMLKLKHPYVQVSVGEQRVFAIPRMLSEHPQTKVILLDDAFQHQSVRPDINILLTTYDKPFYEDYILPIGTLREFRSGMQRANLIVVTKCPETLTEKQEVAMIEKIAPLPEQQVFFSSISYGIPYNLMQANDFYSTNKKDSVLLITGIAQADPLKTYLEEKTEGVVHFGFDDHHYFEQYELESIRDNYPEFKQWITTEKDGVRLALHKDWLIENNIAVYCIPIKTKLIGTNAAKFTETIRDFLDYFYHNDKVEISDTDSIN